MKCPPGKRIRIAETDQNPAAPCASSAGRGIHFSGWLAIDVILEVELARLMRLNLNVFEILLSSLQAVNGSMAFSLILLQIVGAAENRDYAVQTILAE
jgi:hypothetical protein